MSQEVTKILDILAERFGTTIEHLWEIMIRQAYVNAAYFFVLLLLFGVATYFLIRHSPDLIKKVDRAEMVPTFALLFGWFGWIVSVVLFIGELKWAITGLVNPEYWVLQQILELLK